MMDKTTFSGFPISDSPLPTMPCVSGFPIVSWPPTFDPSHSTTSANNTNMRPPHLTTWPSYDALSEEASTSGVRTPEVSPLTPNDHPMGNIKHHRSSSLAYTLVPSYADIVTSWPSFDTKSTPAVTIPSNNSSSSSAHFLPSQPQEFAPDNDSILYMSPITSPVDFFSPSPTTTANGSMDHHHHHHQHHHHHHRHHQYSNTKAALSAVASANGSAMDTKGITSCHHGNSSSTMMADPNNGSSWMAMLGNLTRDQLIERVLQLEQERQRYGWATSPPAPATGVASIGATHVHPHHPSLFVSDLSIINPATAAVPGMVDMDATSTTDDDEEVGDDMDDDEEATIHMCRWADCELQTDRLVDLIAHIRDTHVGSGKPAYYCEWTNCPRQNKPFMKRHKMHNHMRTHTGEKPFICNFQDCDKRFSRLDSLNTHLKTHSSVRPFACSIQGCTKAYFHSRSLRKHLKTHTMIKKPSSSPRRNTKRRQQAAAAAAAAAASAAAAAATASYASSSSSSAIASSSALTPPTVSSSAMIAIPATLC